MKLNPDCLRDILLYIEDVTDLDHPLSIDPYDIPDELSSYSKSEIMYHIKQAQLSDLILVSSEYVDGGCLIRYLLPEGHQFISNIREESNWNKTKNIAKSIGSNSLDAIKQIATGVVTSLIQSALQNQ